MRAFLIWIVAAALLASVVRTSIVLDRRIERRRAAEQDLVYLAPAWLVRTLSLGHRTLAADWYWLQALQYYGNEHNFYVEYRDLHRFIDLVIDLDPDFRYAYYYGGVTVPFNRGRWQWQHIDESSRILERGVERFPDDWRLWMLLGYNLSVLGTDYEGGAEAYARAAGAPGAPPWVHSLVMRLNAAVGAIDRARAYAEEVLARTDDPTLQEIMSQRLVEIDVEAELQRLDRLVEIYEERHGVRPKEMSDLVSAGLLETLPTDPLGGEIELDDQGMPRATSLLGGRLRPFEDR